MARLHRYYDTTSQLGGGIRAGAVKVFYMLEGAMKLYTDRQITLQPSSIIVDNYLGICGKNARHGHPCLPCGLPVPHGRHLTLDLVVVGWREDQEITGRMPPTDMLHRPRHTRPLYKGFHGNSFWHFHALITPYCHQELGDCHIYLTRVVCDCKHGTQLT